MDCRMRVDDVICAVALSGTMRSLTITVQNQRLPSCRVLGGNLSLWFVDLVSSESMLRLGVQMWKNWCFVTYFQLGGICHEKELQVEKEPLLHTTNKSQEKEIFDY